MAVTLTMLLAPQRDFSGFLYWRGIGEGKLHIAAVKLEPRYPT